MTWPALESTVWPHRLLPEVLAKDDHHVTALLSSHKAVLSATGGLNCQIEHHLFPSLPRHNLRAAQRQVMLLCKKHGLVYEACGMLEGTGRVLSCLARVGRLA